MGWFDHRLSLLGASGREADRERLVELATRHQDLAVCAQGAFLLELGAAADGRPGVPSEIQIFKEGQWLEYPREGGLTLTPKHFEQIIANHAAYGTDPVVDREHESVWAMDVPVAQGWVKSMRVGTDAKEPAKAALFATIDWTAPGADAVAGRLFRYISGGVHLNAKDRGSSEPIGARLDHVAICCKPFIDGMRPLTNSAGSGAGRADNGKGANPMNKELQKVLCGLLGLGDGADEAAILKAVGDKEPQIRAAISGKGQVVVLSAAGFAALKLEPAANSAQVEARIVELGAREGELVQLGARIAKIEDEKIVAEVDAAVAAFKYTPAEKELQLELARANPVMWRKITELRVAHKPGGDEVKTLAKPRSSATGEGGAGHSATEQKKLDAVEAHLKANPNTSYGEAVIACAKADPALFAGEEK